MALERLNNAGPFRVVDFLCPDESRNAACLPPTPTPVGCDIEVEVVALRYGELVAEIARRKAAGTWS